jgi:hypothetical protein
LDAFRFHIDAMPEETVLHDICNLPGSLHYGDTECVVAYVRYADFAYIDYLYLTLLFMGFTM